MRARTQGNDIDITVRIRKANLPSLVEGVTLGIDVITGSPIVLRLEQVGENVYSIGVETNVGMQLAVAEPVDCELLES